MSTVPQRLCLGLDMGGHAWHVIYVPHGFDYEESIRGRMVTSVVRHKPVYFLTLTAALLWLGNQNKLRSILIFDSMEDREYYFEQHDKQSVGAK